MPEINLTDEELGLLRELIDMSYRDLRQEIVDTDTSTFKDQLKTREHVLQALLGKLGGPLR